MPPFLSGVIEGFYGPPWSQAERRQVFDRMRDGGLNTYVYAPKDDLKHRALWRETYSAAEEEGLAELVRACRERNLNFIYALSPGLDLRYGDATEAPVLQNRFAQMLALGVTHFALLFDDIPDRFEGGSLAAAQCAVTNALFGWLRERSARAQLAFCPTAYCGRMVAAGLGGAGYLETVGRELAPAIDVFWTGPEIISRELTVAHVRDLAVVLRRKPLVWDNLHANDYDGRRFFCGPYAGRPAELRDEVRGLLVNPNCEAPLNFVPLRTLAGFVQAPATARWDARAAYLAALRDWWPGFTTVGAPLAWEDFVVFCDCYYLPHKEGDEAETLFQDVRRALQARPADAVRRRVARLREFCARLAELRDRALFHALSRRAWELREELDLIERFLASPGPGVASDFHLPGTYRGGLVPRLQRLLTPDIHGTFSPS
ncbi:MAG: beta-N-acetylglucosaminidase domain-containing protein [Verrucomicrobia bacterium]|nr:beta-N-acetylglucosaminidase domain-containing protein [Verrucomicrobiota bacterium]